MTAFELCGQYNGADFKLKRGSVVWEAISYDDRKDKCRVSRIVESGGKPLILGLRYISRYISPDTEVIVIKEF